MEYKIPKRPIRQIVKRLPAFTTLRGGAYFLIPTDRRAGDIIAVDSTNFTTLFGGTENLTNLWRNVALAK
uniref:hypothetical protein n=1 Tax=Nocardia asiatica TaxID=209252 RepID=UPI0002F60DF8